MLYKKFMRKKAIITTIAIIVFILIVLPIGWYYWQNNSGNLGVDNLNPSTNKKNIVNIDDAKNNSQPGVDNLKEIKASSPNMLVYINEKYGYSIEYPKTWWYGWIGDNDGAKADVYWFVSDKSDMELKDGGLPAGAKAEIIVTDLEELKNIDASMLNIDTIEKYAEWQKANQVGFDTEMQGECIEENIKINGLNAIKEVCENPMEESFGKTRKVQLLSSDDKYVFLIQYLGKEPYYSDNTDKFENVYKSFSYKYSEKE